MFFPLHPIPISSSPVSCYLDGLPHPPSISFTCPINETSSYLEIESQECPQTKVMIETDTFLIMLLEGVDLALVFQRTCQSQRFFIFHDGKYELLNYSIAEDGIKNELFKGIVSELKTKLEF